MSPAEKLICDICGEPIEEGEPLIKGGGSCVERIEYPSGRQEVTKFEVNETAFHRECAEQSGTIKGPGGILVAFGSKDGK